MSEIITKKQHQVERTVFDSITKLSHKSEKERIKAGCDLLKHLNQYESNDKNSKEGQYVLRRLVRGLGSSRVLMRSGFFMTLMAILTNNKSIDASMIIEIMKMELNLTGATKSEIGDIYMGQILVCGALLRSGCADECTPEVLKNIIEIISSAAKEKSYLTLAAYTFLKDFINKSTEKSFKTSIWPVLKPELAKPCTEQSIDTLHLLYAVHEKFPEIVQKTFLKKDLEIGDLICSDNMSHMAEMLIRVPTVTLKHPFYEIYCTKIASTEFVTTFWNEIDKYLANPSDKKEIIAITILTYLVSHLERLSVIPDLLSGNFLQLMFQRLKLIRTNHKHELNIKNINLFALITERLSDESVKMKTKLKVIKSLILYPGDFSFERITGTRTIQNITSSLDCGGVKKLAALYRDIILAKLPKNNPKSLFWTIYERVYAAQLFGKLLSLNCMIDEQDWKMEQIKFLMNLGIFFSNDGEIICNKEESAVIGSTIAKSIKECFFGVLGNKQKNLDDLRKLLSSLIDHCNNIITSKSLENSLRMRLTEEDINCWRMMYEFIGKLKCIDDVETNVKVKKIISAFHILSTHMGFQLFQNPVMARNSLKELQTCFDKFRDLGSQKHKKRKSLKEGEKVNDEPEWMEVVVDLILSILSHDSYLLRVVIACVFPHLCPYLNNTIIHQILALLDPKSDANPLSRYAESDSSDEDDSESEEDESDSDPGDEKEFDEDSMSEGSDPESYDDDDTPTDKLRMAVSDALGRASDQESIDLDDIDDEEGKRLNNAVRLIIESRPQKSKKSRKSDKLLTAFRTRLLDLLIIYLNNNPSMYICLEIILPLFKILEFTISDPNQISLQVKTQSCIQTLCNVKKFSSTEGVTDELLFSLLNSLLNNDATANINQARNKENALCCAFIVRCSIIISESDRTKPLKNETTPLIELYKTQLLAFFTKRDNHLPITFFSTVFGIMWNGVWTLTPICVEQSFNYDIRALRRACGLKLLQAFYQNYRLLKSNPKSTVKILNKIETDLSCNIALLTVTDEGFKNENFFQHLVVLLTLIKKFHKLDIDVFPDMMDWEAIKKAVENLKVGLKLSHTTKSFYNKYCAMLNINPNDVNLKLKDAKKANGHNKIAESEVPPKKLKLDENGKSNGVENQDSDAGDVEVNNKKVNKKRQKTKGLNKDTVNLKKQTKLLRLQASTKGLENVSFSKFNADKIKNEEDEASSAQESSDDMKVEKSIADKNSSEIEMTKPKQKKKKRRMSEVE